MKKLAILLIGSVFVFLLFIVVLIIFLPKEAAVIEPTAAEEKPDLTFDKTSFNDYANEIIIAYEGMIVGIKQENILIDVEVSNDWGNLNDVEKEEIAVSVYNQLKKSAVKNQLIHENGSIDVVLVNSSGKQVATKSLMGVWSVK